MRKEIINRIIIMTNVGCPNNRYYKKGNNKSDCYSGQKVCQPNDGYYKKGHNKLYYCGTKVCHSTNRYYKKKIINWIIIGTKIIQVATI